MTTIVGPCWIRRSNVRSSPCSVCCFSSAGDARNGSTLYGQCPSFDNQSRLSNSGLASDQDARAATIQSLVHEPAQVRQLRFAAEGGRQIIGVSTDGVGVM